MCHAVTYCDSSSYFCNIHTLFVLPAVVKLDPKADYSQMKVGQLKQLLKDRGIDSKDCLEKVDFVRKVQQMATASA